VVDEYAKAFGFDRETGVDLYGEKKGNIPTPEWKEKVFNESWRLGDTYNSSIGQFGFTITPIAAARMVAAIVNNGKLVTPRLMISEKSTDVQVQEMVPLVVNDEWYSLARRGMRMTITDGTAKVLNVPYTTVAAKTGTAEIGNTKRYVHSWITGFFPYDEPKYVFAIITEKAPRDDAQSPAFIMKDILDWIHIYRREEYLGLPPLPITAQAPSSATSTEE
jgi:penicillin-binding protein 2